MVWFREIERKLSKLARLLLLTVLPNYFMVFRVKVSRGIVPFSAKVNRQCGR
jgi:hypothetical protein